VVTVVRVLQFIYYGGCTLSSLPNYVSIDEDSMLRFALKHQVGPVLPPDILAKTWKNLLVSTGKRLDARVRLYAFAEEYQMKQIQESVLNQFIQLYKGDAPSLLTLCDKLDDECPVQEEWKKKADGILCAPYVDQLIQIHKDDDRLYDWIHKRELAKRLFFNRL
jgi:hypothetical protein